MFLIHMKAKERQNKTLRKHQWVIEIYFLIPAIITLAGITMYPVAYGVIMSFRDLISGKFTFVGLANYGRLIAGGRFAHSLYITMVFTIVAVIVETILGMLIALLYSDDKISGIFVLRVLLVLPMIVIPIVVAMVFRHLIYEPKMGVLNYFFDLIRLPMLKSKWSCDIKTALFSLILIDIWERTPFPFLVFLAGIKSLPKEPHEAALIDGASPWQTFFYVTLPLLRHIIMVVIVFRVIGCIKAFDIFYGVTAGGPGVATENVSMYIYYQMFKYNRVGTASASTVITMLITFCFVFIIYKAILGKES